MLTPPRARFLAFTALAVLAACKLPPKHTTPGLADGEPTAEASTDGDAGSPAASAAAADSLEPTAELRALVDAPDRSSEDAALDKGRKPAELLAFLGIKPGMKVAELCAGGGYTTELLARAVGPSGTVYGENPRTILQKFAEKPWAARLAKPVNKNVVRVDRELEYPFPPEATDLDAVVMVLFYHDTVWLKTDRERMNLSVFEHLKKGGIYAIVDHAAKDGAGVNDAKTLHRIEQSVVVKEVTAAGFELAREGTFLKNPDDKHDWNDSPTHAGAKRGTSDRFVLVFKKP